jgi:hypothetical protein
MYNNDRAELPPEKTVPQLCTVTVALLRFTEFGRNREKIRKSSQ